MKKGYWMVPLHPESRPLTCMSLNIGNAASDVFQKKLDEVFQNVQGVKTARIGSEI